MTPRYAALALCVLALLTFAATALTHHARACDPASAMPWLRCAP